MLNFARRKQQMTQRQGDYERSACLSKYPQQRTQAVALHASSSKGVHVHVDVTALEGQSTTGATPASKLS